MAIKPEDCVGIKNKNGITRILFSDLAYVEVVNKSVFFHLSDGNVREVNSPLSEYENVLLSRPEFVRTHRAFIVNLAQIGELTSCEAITISGKKVPVSRQNNAQVRNAYMEQLFAKRREG